MNYRHAYHAGNFADVMKHAVITLVVDALLRKDKPFFALDTHAGLGAYDLESVAAGKTGEYLGGIAKVLAAPVAPVQLAHYGEIIRRFNPEGGLRWYPGSPEIIRSMMRPDDRMALVELHPEDVGELRRCFAGDGRVGVHHMDGYVAAKGLLPPVERRGLVLIDPPFEVKDEMDRLLASLRRIRRLWPTGVVMVWYPVKGREPLRRFHQAIRDEGGPKALAAELLIHPDDDPFRLNGSGLLIINPPWRLDEDLAALLPWLAEVLAPDRGGWRLDWLIEEEAGEAKAKG
ncbi:23S rRNA (adenine(2030)-N(6))-methyltransferase RlmJ [Paramagnetospirillum kuznetsovii]|uniref:Ribosomal RNA large subunit methyltransferase J n=1 Tax=Paramagnetospirillum kuznetsovii TaxID=2053833 RepID=A0A364P0K8_9PROT|nr:23S rRNA (adenine(2030)-N(6))-methyltransferase RlmJ [Paramagnetospirillum kuznetsovii]RAU22878.1 23S rRNA (adenine(2030)-N(6))-methyltransferase RlmJ [Paramagnetospirillum kuznetsovii]